LIYKISYIWSQKKSFSEFSPLSVKNNVILQGTYTDSQSFLHVKSYIILFRIPLYYCCCCRLSIFTLIYKKFPVNSYFTWIGNLLDSSLGQAFHISIYYFILSKILVNLLGKFILNYNIFFLLIYHFSIKDYPILAGLQLYFILIYKISYIWSKKKSFSEFSTLSVKNSVILQGVYTDTQSFLHVKSYIILFRVPLYYYCCCRLSIFTLFYKKFPLNSYYIWMGNLLDSSLGWYFTYQFITLSYLKFWWIY